VRENLAAVRVGGGWGRCRVVAGVVDRGVLGGRSGQDGAGCP
jgi:hypothetical protein